MREELESDEMSLFHDSTIFCGNMQHTKQKTTSLLSVTVFSLFFAFEFILCIELFDVLFPDENSLFLIFASDFI